MNPSFDVFSVSYAGIQSLQRPHALNANGYMNGMAGATVYANHYRQAPLMETSVTGGIETLGRHNRHPLLVMNSFDTDHSNGQMNGSMLDNANVGQVNSNLMNGHVNGNSDCVVMTLLPIPI
ncbi:hypothetical protein Ciccas_000823 [Cichlidogyrus casuarinus]|uniref:Uncharacterized protein n=1 Tax=Cichlidogyrus casuarinus TaxID=1844966 RepID=A0ABD2QPS0_9PLAT